jgi:predicted secreted protein
MILQERLQIGDKMIRHLLMVLLVVCAGATRSLAGDFAELNFIGFSEDRRFLAFEEHGTEDGSGFPYSHFFFIDAAGNRYTEPPVKVRIESETGVDARADAKRKADPVLKKLGIIEGNRGDIVVARLPTDRSGRMTTQQGPATTKFARRIFAENFVSGSYELTLTPLPAADKRCEGLDEPGQKLQVDLKDMSTNATTVLQKDEALPDARGCAVYYGLNSIYWNGNKLAIFLEVYSAGFEGHDTRFMAVTGVQADPDFISSKDARPGAQK